ncbi:uncharacterized protein LOC131650824 [Vicia villosa]|uniref:uncharacterized protein LOC131650824 n=1 Tax=Vicia villosa TaxID=3911 RepID=UPI00273CE223|nr:uncharacterized protein LOC131650824 [Vicia villosa]
MSNLAKLDFGALDISEKNYLPWALDAEIHLNVEGHGNAIKEGNISSDQQKTKAMIFLRRHLHEDLKNEYLTVIDPYVLWKNLKERYAHQKLVILPKARYDWMHLRLQDFKSVSDYNSVMFRITSKLTLCGKKVTDEDMLEKTFSTFHASNVLLQQHYREKGFNKYSDLISCLLVAEQNNELLMKNHEARPAGTTPFPKVNVARHDHYVKNHGRGRARGRGRGRAHNNARGLNFDHNRNGNHKNVPFHQKWKDTEKNEKGGQSSKSKENYCYRCGGKGHWGRTCRTPKHLVDLYQKSLKSTKTRIETNFSNEDGYPDYGNIDVTHLDIGDFFADPNEKIDHLIGDGTVKK